MSCRWGAVFWTVVVLASCAQDDDRVGAPGSTEAEPPTTAPVTPSASPRSSVAPAPGRLLACEALPVLAAPADRYRDRPVYVGGDQPVGRVRAWARRQS